MRPKTPPSNTASPQVSNEDIAEFRSSLALESSTGSIVQEEKSAPEKRDFWWLLGSNDRRSEINVIVCDDTLKRGDVSYGMGKTIHVHAEAETTGQWKLEVRPTGDTGANVRPVFLLNYKALETKWVERSLYENNHDFFMTVELSGCRFTLTENHVLHVAWDARDPADTEGAPPSKATRDAAAEAARPLLPGTRTRSVSMTASPNSIFYPQTGDHLYGVLLRGHAVHKVPSLLIGKLKEGTSASDIAQKVEEVLSNLSLGGAPTRVTRATEALAEQLKGNILPPLAEVSVISKITDEFEESCWVHSRAARKEAPYGAFVVGVRQPEGWRYYVLTGKYWQQILPG